MIIHTISKFFKFALIPLLLGFPIAVIAYRLNVWEMGTSFKIIQLTGFVSAAVFLLSVVLGVFSLIKKQKDVAKVYAIVALLLAIPVIGLLGQATKAKSLPFIHHITTDTVNPPKFERIVELRGQNSNPLDYDSETLAPLQQSAYPNVQPIVTNLSATQAFNKALATVMQSGWEVVNKNEQTGMIEAVDTTLLWGFKDDVVIRVTAIENGSKVDLRSISRIGLSDLGVNAKRIEQFIKDFNAK